MQVNKTFYPHRIPFASIGNCDVCSRTGEKIYSLPFSKYLGLVCCKNKNCSNILKLSMQKTTIPLAKLVEKYGETVKVERTDGTTDEGWNLISYAFKENIDSDFWVYVEKNNKTKCITLSKLELLNV